MTGITRNRALGLSGAAIAGAAVGVSARASGTELGTAVAIGALTAAVSLVVLATFRIATRLGAIEHHLAKIEQSVDQHSAEHRRDADARRWDYAQIESLLNLYRLIDIRRALPPTRGWATCPDFLLSCVEEILERHPKLVIECGSGVSTVMLAYALQQRGGQLLSLEHDERYADRTRDLVRRHGLEDVATVVHAPLEIIVVDGTEVPWYHPNALSDVGECDMLVVDGPPGNVHPLTRYAALPVLGRLLSANAVVFLDDARRKNERIIAERWAKEHGLHCDELAHEKGTFVFTVRDARRAITT